MKKHKGMRPHDIVILLKIATLSGKSWLAKNIAQSLGISASEVSESLNRSRIAVLISEDKKDLMKNNLIDFLGHGLSYVYPAEVGSIQRGIPTAHSASPLNKLISASESFVWPWSAGTARGQSIEPLHPAVPDACNNDPQLYELLALTDALRIGRTREKQLAIKELRRRII